MTPWAFIGWAITAATGIVIVGIGVGIAAAVITAAVRSGKDARR